MPHSTESIGGTKKEIHQYGNRTGKREVQKRKENKKTKKEKQPKLYSVSKYEMTPKADGEKFAPFFGKDNKRYAAVILQALRKAKEAIDPCSG